MGRSAGLALVNKDKEAKKNREGAFQGHRNCQRSDLLQTRSLSFLKPSPVYFNEKLPSPKPNNKAAGMYHIKY